MCHILSSLGLSKDLIYEYNNISKTNNNTKKVIYAKNEHQSIPIYPANLATFENSWIFERPKCPFWTATAPRRDMKVFAHFFYHITHHLCRDGHFWLKGGEVSEKKIKKNWNQQTHGGFETRKIITNLIMKWRITFKL